KAGPYNGLSVYEARKKIVEDLKKLGLIVKSEKILHRTPECWRSKNPIEFISMREYYLKQLEVSDDLLQIVDLIKFYPAASKQLLLNWISSITTDWPISRRRYYGTEIPIWYCKKCGKPHLPKTGKYYQPWKEKAPFNRCDCGSNEFLGETRTFDTWMDSSGSALYIAGYERDVDLFNKAFPVYLRPQGTDIVRSWLYYSILKAYHLTRKPAFREVRISGMGLDEKGEAMHKSKGNVVYPEPLFQKYGADAFRLWGAMEAKVGSDYRFSENRVEGASKFITKLWNIARFVSSFPQPQEDYELTSLDKMILAELNKLVDACRKGYDYTDAFIPSTAMRNFTWSLFADHYVEAAKSRAYNPNYLFTEKAQHGAWYTLHACLQTLLKLLAPLCPFVSDFIWRELYGKESIHLESFPEKKAELESELIKITEKFIEFNTAIWKYKKDSGIALNESLDLVYAPEELKPLKIDLEAMHKIRDLNFGVAKAELLRIGKDIYVAK
ncbi:MAG TPA: class I tRNA ligase family protein, partial [archaeon]|nr:class I tRNA ligase family protein [archaeon]